MEELISLLYAKFEQNCNVAAIDKAHNFVNNIVEALDKVAPRRIFKIPNKWEGKKMVFTGDKSCSEH